ncbi:hypothetical protein STSV1pORF10 [Sulfolobus virus STSV1]|uniref:hypothetical protein n=1 Tax=Sulfolobus virus STSV1 TaxID=285013 RepID=UPI000042B0F8|nr:hypothetical protein STSV1pORF10 [Sulfolobus virus STSV1]CAH04193.1 hypothetical protein [Sulfolobus virus STSV1]
MSQPVSQPPTSQNMGDKLIELREKIKEYIEDLEDLRHDYDLPDFDADDLRAELEYISKEAKDAELPASVKEVIELAASALDEQLEKALKNGKALQSAYYNNGIHDMFLNAVKLYANLKTINTIVQYIKQYVKVLGITEANLERFTQEAGSIIAILANHIAQHVKLSEDDARDLENELIYFHDLAENEPDVDDALKEIEDDLENDTELRRGTYRALMKVLDAMQEHGKKGVGYGNGADEIMYDAYDADEEEYKPDEIDTETLLLNLAETYAHFTALQALYKNIINDYITNETLEDAVEVALNRAKAAIGIILNGYNNN